MAVSQSASKQNAASCQSIPTHITKEAVNRLPLAAYNGPLHLISCKDALRECVPLLKKERVLGFDTETKPSFRPGQNHPPALIQLATAKCVYLFQISQMDGFEPLLPLFESKRILKVGIALHDDIKKLQEIHAFNPAGFIEVSQLSQRLQVTNTGLRSLAAIFLQQRVSKGAQVSNWAAPKLSPKQLHYAALDAWISRLLYLKIKPLVDSCESKAAATPKGQRQKPAGTDSRSSAKTKHRDLALPDQVAGGAADQ